MATQIELSEICSFRRYQHIVRQGEATRWVYQLESGWTCTYRLIGDERRQITALHLPGEYCEPQWLFQPTVAQPLLALTSVSARKISLAGLCAGSGHQRALLAALMASFERQSAWIAALGRKTASERICALFSDIFERMRRAGRVIGDTCAMPLTQTDIADIAGLTPVHVNRVLKALRARGLVELQHKALRVIEPDALRELGAELGKACSSYAVAVRG